MCIRDRVLTKPIGIGVLTSAGKADLLTTETVDFMNRMMTTLNKAARDVMVRYKVHACTDVTGFGLKMCIRDSISPVPCYNFREYVSLAKNIDDISKFCNRRLPTMSKVGKSEIIIIQTTNTPLNIHTHSC